MGADDILDYHELFQLDHRVHRRQMGFRGNRGIAQRHCQPPQPRLVTQEHIRPSLPRGGLAGLVIRDCGTRRLLQLDRLEQIGRAEIGSFVDHRHHRRQFSGGQRLERVAQSSTHAGSNGDGVDQIIHGKLLVRGKAQFRSTIAGKL